MLRVLGCLLLFSSCCLKGVLIACYLIYTLRISPSEAVHYVRIKRPRSIQTRSQINQVFDFARLLGTQLTQYPDLSLRHGAPFTLQHYLNRQALLLHGQEARRLRHTPKVEPWYYTNLSTIKHRCSVSQLTWISFLTPFDQVVYLLCVRLSCLALGLASPPEVHAELEKRSALRVLSRAVRETLVSKQYLPLLSEGRKGSWAGSGSVSSWDEPLGFLERKHEVLLDKRSYSESDVTKIIVYEVKRIHNCKYFNSFELFRWYSLLCLLSWRTRNWAHTAPQLLEMRSTGAYRISYMLISDQLVQSLAHFHLGNYISERSSTCSTLQWQT